MIRRLAAATAAGLIGGTLMLAGTASATPEGPLTASHERGECGEVTITFTNNTPHTYDADIRVNGQQGTPDADMPDPHNHGVTPDQSIASGPHAGEKFGKRYTPVLLPAGETITETVEVDKDTAVEYRIWRGPENDYYLNWTTVDVEACPETEPEDKGGKEKEETDPAPGKGGAADELPVTGAALPVLIGAGLLLLVGGSTAMVLARRRLI